jgi:hypothetical protein
MVDLTLQHKNRPLLVEGPEIQVRPIGTRPSSMRGCFTADQLQIMIDLYQSGTTAEQLAQTSGFSKRIARRPTPASRHESASSGMNVRFIRVVRCPTGKRVHTRSTLN